MNTTPNRKSINDMTPNLRKEKMKGLMRPFSMNQGLRRWRTVLRFTNVTILALESTREVSQSWEVAYDRVVRCYKRLSEN